MMRTLALCILLLIVPALTGCTAVPIATISAAAGAAAATTEVTSAVYKSGKLRSAEMASFEQMHEALSMTVDDLGYNVKQENIDEGRHVRVVIEDEQYKRIVINIERHTPKVCTLMVDVGWLGAQHIARLFYERFKAELKIVLEQTKPAA